MNLIQLLSSNNIDELYSELVNNNKFKLTQKVDKLLILGMYYSIDGIFEYCESNIIYNMYMSTLFPSKSIDIFKVNDLKIIKQTFTSILYGDKIIDPITLDEINLQFCTKSGKYIYSDETLIRCYILNGENPHNRQYLYNFDKYSKLKHIVKIIEYFNDCGNDILRSLKPLIGLLLHIYVYEHKIEYEPEKHIFEEYKNKLICRVRQLFDNLKLDDKFYEIKDIIKYCVDNSSISVYPETLIKIFNNFMKSNDINFELPNIRINRKRKLC